jgi:hypothetical protein
MRAPSHSTSNLSKYQRYALRRLIITLAFLAGVVLVVFASSAQANFKCKGDNGKVEYSDRPCGEPYVAANTGPAKVSPTLERLTTLISSYDTRLCEREKLATEVDRASRAGEANGPEWAEKKSKLRELTDEQAAFQEKAGKLARAAGPDSPEAAAMRAFQIKMKECAKLKK